MVMALSRRMPAHRVRQKQFNTTIGLSGSIWSTAFLVNGVAQGDDDNQRTSDSIGIKSLEWRFAFTSATAIDAASSIRYIFVLDKQSNGNNATTGTIFATDDRLTSTYDNVYVPKRYRVLHDETFSLNEFAANTAVTAKRAIVRKKRYKRPLKIRYKNVNAVIGDIMSGSITLFMIADNVPNPPSVILQTKIEYIDL